MLLETRVLTVWKKGDKKYGIRESEEELHGAGLEWQCQCEPKINA